MNYDRDDILTAIKKRLRELAPNAKTVLFGSRAKGNAFPDSDWDILILLDKEKIEISDYDNIAYPLFELGWDFDQHFSIKLYTLMDWERRSFTLFYKNVEKNGILL